MFLYVIWFIISTGIYTLYISIYILSITYWSRRKTDFFSKFWNKCAEYVHKYVIHMFLVAGKNLYTMYFIYKHESIKVTESDLIHLRVCGGQSVNSSVASLAVFILDELQPLLIRRLRTQLLCRRHSGSPHLIGQLVTVGKKQLGEEAIKCQVSMVQSPLTFMTGSVGHYLY